jgi:hypothetical protein
LSGASSSDYKTYGPLKIKFIYEPPLGAPFGARPETHFVRMSSRHHQALGLLAKAEGLDMEGAMVLAIRRFLEDFESGSASANGPEDSGAGLPSS